MRIHPKRALNSYSFKIALMYVLFFLVSTLILFGFIYLTSTRNATTELDNALSHDKTLFVERYAQSGLNGLIRLINSRAQSEGENVAYSLIDAEQAIIAGNLERWPKFNQDTALTQFEVNIGTQEYAYPFRGELIGLPEGFVLLLARSKQRIVAAQSTLVRTFSWAALITLLLGLIGGYLLSNRAMRRIANINRLCTDIIEGDFSQRLAIIHPQDDLDELSLNINLMLNKIETLMNEVIQVSDNIAHDMRTPLSHLRLKLESMQTQALSDATQQGLGESIEDVDDIINTFNALLRISKLNNRHKNRQFKPLILSQLSQDVMELYAPLAEEKSQIIHVNVSENMTILGDKNLVFQALSNIMDNAIKYTPEHGQIHLSLCAEHQQLLFKVCDNGIGVAEDELNQLTQRFYRVDTSRSLPGNGLGLSLVKAIARAHDADLILSQNHPKGLCVTLSFTRYEG